MLTLHAILIRSQIDDGQRLPYEGVYNGDLVLLADCLETVDPEWISVRYYAPEVLGDVVDDPENYAYGVFVLQDGTLITSADIYGLEAPTQASFGDEATEPNDDTLDEDIEDEDEDEDEEDEDEEDEDEDEDDDEAEAITIVPAAVPMHIENEVPISTPTPTMPKAMSDLAAKILARRAVRPPVAISSKSTPIMAAAMQALADDDLDDEFGEIDLESDSTVEIENEIDNDVDDTNDNSDDDTVEVAAVDTEVDEDDMDEKSSLMIVDADSVSDEDRFDFVPVDHDNNVSFLSLLDD